MRIFVSAIFKTRRRDFDLAITDLVYVLNTAARREKTGVKLVIVREEDTTKMKDEYEKRLVLFNKYSQWTQRHRAFTRRIFGGINQVKMWGLPFPIWPAERTYTNHERAMLKSLEDRNFISCHNGKCASLKDFRSVAACPTARGSISDRAWFTNGRSRSLSQGVTPIRRRQHRARARPHEAPIHGVRHAARPRCGQSPGDCCPVPAARMAQYGRKEGHQRRSTGAAHVRVPCASVCAPPWVMRLGSCVSPWVMLY